MTKRHDLNNPYVLFIIGFVLCNLSITLLLQKYNYGYQMLVNFSENRLCCTMVALHKFWSKLLQILKKEPIKSSSFKVVYYLRIVEKASRSS